MLSVADVTRPVGRLDPTWFADGTLQALVDKANTLTLTDKARAYWVQHRAFQQLADDATMRPSRVAADDVSEAYSADQLSYWRRAAAEALDSLNALTGSTVDGGYRPVQAVW